MCLLRCDTTRDPTRRDRLPYCRARIGALSLNRSFFGVAEGSDNGFLISINCELDLLDSRSTTHAIYQDLCAHAIIVWRIWVLWRAADNWIIVLGLVNVPFMLGVCMCCLPFR